MARVSTLHRAAILAVGSELLTPSRIDTNSLFITEQLNLLGIEVAYKSVVGDDREELAAAIRVALDRVGLVVCCGGLGPTDDDVTREVVAQVLQRPLTEDERITSQIRARFASRRMEMPEINRRQAMVPAGARVLSNRNGTAPGLWLEEAGRAVLLLPGPPRELKAMLTSASDDILRPRSPGFSLVRCIVRITGRTESHAEEAVQPLYTEWARAEIPIVATILASLGQIELHLSARAASRVRAEAAVEAASRQVAEVLGLDAYSRDGRTLEQVVGDLLVDRRFRIALAESCTGGLVTSRLTDVAGSSRYVDRAVVAYA
ncbi:MAG: CinA-like protein, partial [Acidobacteria bacterium]|nr:CinA-like protein [Acidobacteriota bacterium]